MVVGDGVTLKQRVEKGMMKIGSVGTTVEGAEVSYQGISTGPALVCCSLQPHHWACLTGRNFLCDFLSPKLKQRLLGS